MIKKQQGFTLVELLIVIVIIGLLAGVLVAIINPEKQQNRAKDAGVQATISKVSLATQGYISAYGNVPEGDEFIASLNNATAIGSSCVSGSYTCLFEVTGNDLPEGECAADGYTNTATGSNDCYFYYEGTVNAGSADTFTIYGASHGIVDTTFVYDSAVGEIVTQ